MRLREAIDNTIAEVMEESNKPENHWNSIGQAESVLRKIMLRNMAELLGWYSDALIGALGGEPPPEEKR